MNDELPPGSLHPNLARIAAAYDHIIEQMANRLLTPVQARAQIEQLEARDDQGIRWSIDADSGRFVRKTLMGDTHFDTPPTSGYQTDDAYSYSATRGGESDPNMRMEMYATEDSRLTHSVDPIPGATRNGPSPEQPAGLGPLAKVPPVYRWAALTVLVLALLLFLLS